MHSKILRSLSLVAVAASIATLGACASESAPTAAHWNFPGEQPPAQPKPLMRMATLPLNPAPAAPYEDYTNEPSRFLFHSHIVVLDDGSGATQDNGAADAAAEASADGGQE